MELTFLVDTSDFAFLVNQVFRYYAINTSV